MPSASDLDHQILRHGVIHVQVEETSLLRNNFRSLYCNELLGEGGAGRVYGGVGPEGTAITLKVLAEERAAAHQKSISGLPPAPFANLPGFAVIATASHQHWVASAMYVTSTP